MWQKANEDDEYTHELHGSEFFWHRIFDNLKHLFILPMNWRVCWITCDAHVMLTKLWLNELEELHQKNTEIISIGFFLSHPCWPQKWQSGWWNIQQSRLSQEFLWQSVSNPWKKTLLHQWEVNLVDGSEILNWRLYQNRLSYTSRQVVMTWFLSTDHLAGHSSTSHWKNPPAFVLSWSSSLCSWNTWP